MADRTIRVTLEAEADISKAEADLSRLQNLGKSLASDLSSGLEGVLFKGKSLEQTLKSLALNFSRRAFSSALQPLENAAGSFFGNLLSNAMPFAKGGVFDGPQAFTFGSNLGVLGEAGPEAVMPLARDGSGRLGVVAQEGKSNVTVNISTPDIASFQRSNQQVAASIARAVARGQRSL